MNNKQLDALIRLGQPTMIAVDKGLYFRIARGKPSWVVKYTLHGKRSQLALPNGYPIHSIAQAKQDALQIRANIKLGIDPKTKRKRHQQTQLHTVNDLFNDWCINDIDKRLKHPSVPKRYYKKYMKNAIGNYAIKDVIPTDIREMVNAVQHTGKPSATNKTLMYAKQLFNHAVKLDLIRYSPAQAFTEKDAAGHQEGRKRHLSLDEIDTVFLTLRKHNDIFTRDNYLAFCLLLLLGTRKGELISAQWHQFDIQNRLWHMSIENKTSTAISIPLSDTAIAILKELHIRACGSDYVFPARRLSKKQAFISHDTINHALNKMFGHGNKKKYPTPNYLGDAGIEHFTVHDLRRTCRSLLAKLGIQFSVAERCLNHKPRGIEAVYNQHDYLNERREALDLLANTLSPLIYPSTAELE
ncbi:tyrosine-type recombinase/integrase [Photobacterium leiognathi]|uniref:tyrosine-type recombinase/integrase n=1 Tax=Photobacterium leiognathi TaxID=553611 RepID=UPI003AF369BD